MITSDVPRYTSWEDLLRSWLTDGQRSLAPARSVWKYRLADDLLLDDALRVVALRARDEGKAFYLVSAFRRRTWTDRACLEAHGVQPLLAHEFAEVLLRVGLAHGEGPKDIDPADEHAFAFIDHWVDRRGKLPVDSGFSWRTWRVQSTQAGLKVAYPLGGDHVSLVVARFVDENTCQVVRQVHRRNAVLWVRDAVYCAMKRRPPLVLQAVTDLPGPNGPASDRLTSSRPSGGKRSYSGFANFLHRWVAGDISSGRVRAHGEYELKADTLLRRGIPVAAKILGSFYYALAAFHCRRELRVILEREGFIPLLGFELDGLLRRAGATPYSAYAEWKGDGAILDSSRAWVRGQGKSTTLSWRSTQVKFTPDKVAIRTPSGWEDIARRDGGSDIVLLEGGRGKGRARLFVEDAIYRACFICKRPPPMLVLAEQNVCRNRVRSPIFPASF